MFSVTPRMQIYGGEFGKGRVIFVAGTEWWTRKRLGHAFTIPGADARACYWELAEILEKHAGLAPPHRRLWRILEE